MEYMQNWHNQDAIEKNKLKMQPQIIKDGAISADTIDKDKLIYLCKEMLKESVTLGTMDEEAQSKFIARYQTFSQEYPVVFNDIMVEKRFYVVPFLKYLQYKAKQPLVYTDSEQSVKDLCYYPLQLFKYLNKHYDQDAYRDFKKTLWDQMYTHHTEQKEQMKQMVQSVTQSQQKIKDSLIQNIIKLATQQQLQN